MRPPWLLVIPVLPVLLAASPSLAAPRARNAQGQDLMGAVGAARAHRQAHGPAILAELAQLLAIPCVAGDSAGIARTGEFVRRAFARRGIELESWTLPGASPLLFGEWRTPGATTTLGIYVHYDGQPVDPTRWTFGPWTPTLTTAALEAGGTPRALPEAGQAIDPEWRLYGRSAGDDKAPLIAWLAALDALRAADMAPLVNLKFLLDGEEEAGSPHLGEYIEQHRDRLDVDVWLFCDGPVHQSRRPQLCFGVRGITGMDLTLYGALRPLHSGHYGNWAPNPGERLARLLTSMKDEQGRVVVEGYYDSTAPPGPAERAALAELPDFEAAMRLELGLPPRRPGEDSYFEALMRPSLNVRGLASGNVGAESRNIVPSVARASLDLRLVRGNQPQAMLDLLERHIEGQGFTIVRDDPDAETLRSHRAVVKVERRGGYAAASSPMDLPIVQRVTRGAQRAAGEELLLVPTLGGSLPLYLFTEGLGKPIVIVPIANHDDNQHAPDENLRIANLWYGIELFAALATLEEER